MSEEFGLFIHKSLRRHTCYKKSRAHAHKHTHKHPHKHPHTTNIHTNLHKIKYTQAKISEQTRTHTCIATHKYGGGQREI